MLSRLRNTESQGRLVIDLEILLYNKGKTTRERWGFAVCSTNTPYAVSVSGEVQFPTSHLFEEGLGLEDYLQKAEDLPKTRMRIELL